MTNTESSAEGLAAEASQNIANYMVSVWSGEFAAIQTLINKEVLRAVLEGQKVAAEDEMRKFLSTHSCY